MNLNRFSFTVGLLNTFNMLKCIMVLIKERWNSFPNLFDLRMFYSNRYFLSSKHTLVNTVLYTHTEAYSHSLYILVSKYTRVNSGSWRWTGRPAVLQSMGSQRVGHDWATELNWTECVSVNPKFLIHPYPLLGNPNSVFDVCGTIFVL